MFSNLCCHIFNTKNQRGRELAQQIAPILDSVANLHPVLPPQAGSFHAVPTGRSLEVPPRAAQSTQALSS